MKYDHWIKIEGNQENHHVLNDLPLKRALWRVKKGSNAKNSYWNIVFPTWSLLTLRWRWWFRRFYCLHQNCVTIEFSEFHFSNEPLSKQFRNKNASYHYAGTVDAQMLSYFFEMFKNCLESWFNHFWTFPESLKNCFVMVRIRFVLNYLPKPRHFVEIHLSIVDFRAFSRTK